MAEDEFLWFCAANPDLRVERNKHGQILIMTPTGSETGIFDSELTIESRNMEPEDQTGQSVRLKCGIHHARHVRQVG